EQPRALERTSSTHVGLLYSAPNSDGRLSTRWVRTRRVNLRGRTFLRTDESRAPGRSKAVTVPRPRGATMPTRDRAPIGSPCWVDLWTSDVEGSRKFYAELFGWEAQAPSPEFGGYFMFTRNGVPTAGAMGDMGERAADNSGKI